MAKIFYFLDCEVTFLGLDREIGTMKMAKAICDMFHVLGKTTTSENGNVIEEHFDDEGITKETLHDGLGKGQRNFNSHWEAQVLVTAKGCGDGVKLGCTWSEFEVVKLGCEIDDSHIVVTETTIKNFFDKRKVMSEVFKDFVKFVEVTDKTSSAIFLRNDESRKGPLAD